MKPALADVDEIEAPDPRWRQVFNAVRDAATVIKERGDGIPDMAALFDHAGVDEAEWYKACRFAKREAYDEIKTFYADVLGRKMREPGATSRRQRAEPEDEVEVQEDQGGATTTSSRRSASHPPTPPHGSSVCRSTIDAGRSPLSGSCSGWMTW